jgi:hypothetical protein
MKVYWSQQFYVFVMYAFQHFHNDDSKTGLLPMNKIFSAVCIFGTDFVDSGTESLVLMLDITDAGNGQTRW